ncbi:MAG TPA: signal peptidase I [Candidatus Acidoferrales bacterium]|nr:signal peptidase I [Candidatus Acidoferrales bacterium]
MTAEADQAVATDKAAPPETRLTTSDRVWREVVSWIWVILAFLFIEGTLAQARVIPSGSMEQTVLVGDHLIVSRFGYDAGIPFTNWHVPLWRNPRRQQIIVFRAPLPGSQDFIKRVIGIPGDHLRIVHGQVFVNGAPLQEPYAYHDVPGYLDSAAENFPARAYGLFSSDNPSWHVDISQHEVNGELVIPPHEYFMMGDNRDDSYDSRYWGFVPRSDVIGTPEVIYMSIKAPDSLAWDPGHIAERFETYFSALIHPKEVRWRRLFHTFHKY